MSQYLTIQQAFDAAAALVGGTAVSPAGNWTSGTAYTLLLVAWDDPDEIDITRARCINGPSPVTSSRMYDSVVTVTPGASNLSITLSWNPPKRPPKSHYAVYQQTASSYTRGAAAQKVLPQASERVRGNIPPWATSCTLDSKTTIAFSYDVPVDSIDSGANTYTVRGNWLGHVVVGTIIRYNDATNQTVTSVALTYGEYGVQTVIGVASASGSAVYLNINASILYVPASGASIFGANIQVIDFPLDARPRTVQGINGLLNERTLTNNAVFDGGDIRMTYVGGDWFGGGQTGGTANAVYQLNDYANKLTPVEIFATVNAATDVIAYRVWRGMLKPPSTTGLKEMNVGSLIDLMFECDTTIDSSNWMRWFDISANTSSTFTISGDRTADFYEGRRFYVNNSTAQNGLYATSSSAYTAATDITVITVTTPVSGTDGDGRIELWQ